MKKPKWKQFQLRAMPREASLEAQEARAVVNGQAPALLLSLTAIVAMWGEEWWWCMYACCGSGSGSGGGGGGSGNGQDKMVVVSLGTDHYLVLLVGAVQAVASFSTGAGTPS